MLFSGSNYNLNNFDYSNSNYNLNGSFLNPMIGVANYNNSLWPNMQNRSSGYYDNILYSSSDLSQSLNNIPFSSNFAQTTSQPSFFQKFLDLFGSNSNQVVEAEDEVKVSQGSDQLVNIAKTQLGKNENDGSYHKFTKGHDVEWCAAFVTWCLRKNGTAVKGDNGKWNENWSCDKLAKNLLEEDPDALAFDRKKGLTDTSEIKPGAVIFFSDGHTSKDYTHTGIVDYVDEDGNIHTIEGNTGDKVAKKSYSANNKYVQTVVNVC